MDTLTAGTFVGSGSFRCRQCGYTLTLEGTDVLTDCPSCGGRDFARASLFSTARIAARNGATQAMHLAGPTPDAEAEIARARERIERPGEYLAYEEKGETHLVALAREWTRIGRSLAADLRLDDPTVSRRHALIVHHPDGVRLLDDRSLNGVFVNGARVDGQLLHDGDEIVVGRYRLRFLSREDAGAQGPSEPSALHTIG